jgi:hypothetical protein
MTFWKPKSTWTPAAVARCLRTREDQVRATLKVTDANPSLAAWELDMLRRQVKFARVEAKEFLMNPVVLGEERQTLERIARDLDLVGLLIAQVDVLVNPGKQDEAKSIGERIRMSYSFAASRLMPPATME